MFQHEEKHQWIHTNKYKNTSVRLCSSSLPTWIRLQCSDSSYHLIQYILKLQQNIGLASIFPQYTLIYLYICFSGALEKCSSYQLPWLLSAILINFLKCFEECTEIPSSASCQLEGYYKILHLLTRGFPQYLSSWQPALLDRSFQEGNTVPVAGRFDLTVGVGVSQEELLTISSSLDIYVVLLPLQHLCA